ncbi:hypothetical protein MCOR02_002330 [Pyricularia oryzae]|uniref:Bystin n=1 Tax=Pyricularia grisea TaxID=148305 RepID=A0ABQ8N7X0_PYRGI|nr:hypothetical protein MCOR02_002330 [Pyricularia oryzae]KAI6291437.1 hypothetical protein MCOR33_010615 [Pyricularia grisea]KAI6452722.1 hypothetical protein MCOR17_009423 [Pyricularia oryzae]KAI6469115.1 hypothetical protein MCOR15_001896 [Pyricularia oryzae]KAI6485834.1 hypothetical protein MCOR13_009594 [Pyricularia oryzae]
MPKATTPNARSRRHNPLESDILATGVLRQKAPKRKHKESTEAENYVDSRASQQILALGRELLEDERQEGGAATEKTHDAFALESGRFQNDDVADDEFPAEDDAWGSDEEVEEVEVDPEDLEAFNRFLPADGDDDPLLRLGWGGQGDAEEEAPTNLADIILAKIQEKEAMDAGKIPQVSAVEEEMQDLPPKVVEVYTIIGQMLARYKSGKLPKPFKVLPTIPRWEDILVVTNPEQWTPNAVYAATKIFSSANSAAAQRFMELVVLDAFKTDIFEHKKLNPHLFNALKKGLYRPAAWFKGFLFPLVSGGCTLREAAIVAAALARVSVPVLHSAAAIKGLCDIAAQEASQGTEGGGATNILLRCLLEKKYALPYQCIDALVFHFLRFRNADPASVREEDVSKIGKDGAAMSRIALPVIWHQCLLSFAQHYRDQITEEQRELLLDLLLTHGHSGIGPEVRRELLAGRGRGVPLEQEGPAFDGDDTMLVD